MVANLLGVRRKRKILENKQNKTTSFHKISCQLQEQLLQMGL